MSANQRIQPFLGRSGSVLPLVDYSTFEVLFSFARKLNPSYSGSAFRIIRTSDSAQQDIGFSGSDVDSAAISSFCSGTTGRIYGVYNQGTLGSVYDLVTLVATRPIIYESGATITLNGKPAAKTDPSTSPIIRASNIVTANGIHDKNGLQNSIVFKRNSTGTATLLMILERDNSLTNRSFNVFDDLRASGTAISQQTVDVSGSSLQYPSLQSAAEISISGADYYLDGISTKGSGLKNGVEFYDNNQVRVWTSTNNRFFDMFRASGDFIIQEYVARIKASTAKDLAGITAIADEQNTYYGIY